ncbi:TRAP transporter substrate-binding protein [Spirochaeta isovalerica]|uniref:Tripartite ATP-independent transporter DctP family solute receptor n=1 Tax=Spirochaeta isovalerica TaxID=150 RepID=A0A841RBD2_9SPIO|nr:TRAP transporter substrate-binding protein [Spirochaeta isovalerica]MBB6481243.1 tripartite ATP-independent transporter DctP family solute receptor [Spirochaeta isovalerica]
MKKILLILFVMVLAATSVMAGGQQGDKSGAPAEEKPVTLVYAEVNNLETIVGKTGLKFKEEVERLSGGTVKLDIQHSGVLGAEPDVLDAMLGGGGTIDMSRISAFALTSYGGEKSKLLSIPYTFTGREHFWKFATSELAPEFLLEPHENGTGIRGLFYGEEGFRHFFGTSPLNTMADLAGMKIRVSNDPVARGMVEGIGASPTVVSYSELYSALQSGVVDAAEQPIANYYGMSFHEVAPYMILDGHTLGAIQVIITDEAWDKLSPNQQNALVEAGKIASAYNRELSEGAENEVLKKLAAEGAVVVEVKDKGPWQAACADVIKESSASNAALYQKILDMQ